MQDTNSAPAAPEAGRFATTHWATVLAAGQADTVQATPALAELCRIYWFPLYVYVRRRGWSEEEAKDLTQGFFEHLLATEALAKASPDRGRFRSFLLKSLQHFLANEHRHARRLRRGGGQVMVALDDTAETRYQIEPFHTLTPEDLFERRWALALIAEALRRLRADYQAAGLSALHAELEPTLTGMGPNRSLAQIGEHLGMSEAAVKVAAHRLRKRFGHTLRAMIQDTLANPADAEEVLRHLQAILAGGLTTLGATPSAGNLETKTG